MATDVGELKVKLSFDDKQFKQVINKIPGENSKAANQTSSVWKNAAQAIVNDVAIKAFNALANSVKQVGSSVVQVGSEFESSMSEVAAITGASETELEMLESTARQFGASTVFSASESAQALKYMGLAGWDAETSTAALGGVLDLAAASGMELAAASNMVTDYLSAFGMEAEESAYFADMLSYAQNNSSTTAEALGEAYKNCAANFNAAGQDVETTTSLLSMMANQGLRGSEAGTALNAVMRDMTAKMKNGAIEIGNTSVQVMDANGNYRDMTEILKDVEKATNGMGNAERTAALSTTFTADSIKGVNMIMNEGVDEAAKFEEALRGSEGAAKTAAEIMNNNLQGQLKILKSNYEDVSLTVYKQFLPSLTQGATGINNLVSAIGLVLNGADPSEAIGKFVANLGQALVNGLSQLGTTIGQVVPVLLEAAVKILPSLTQGLITGISNMIAGLSQSLPDVLNAIVQAINQIAGMLTAPDIISQFLQAGVDMLVSIVNAIPLVLPQLVNAIMNIIPQLVQVLTDPGNLASILNAMLNLLMALVNAIPIIIPQLVAMLPTIINNLLQFFMENISVILDGAVQLFMALIQALPVIIQSLMAALPQIINSVITFLTEGDTISQILDAAITVFFALIDALPQIIEALTSALPDIITSIVDFLTDPGTIMMLIQAAITLFFALIKAVPQILGALIGAFGSLVGSLWESIKGMFGAFARNFGEFIGGIFKGAINGLLAFIENMINTPINLLNGFIDGINSVFGVVGVSLGHIDLVALPRMEYGGIVPGNSWTGDNELIRANSGEMVITRSQQADLWNFIQGSFAPSESESGAIGASEPITVNQTNYFEKDLTEEQIEEMMSKSIRRAVA